MAWRGYIRESWSFMGCDGPPSEGRKRNRHAFWCGAPRAFVRLLWFILEYEWRVRVVGRIRALLYRPEPGAGGE